MKKLRNFLCAFMMFVLVVTQIPQSNVFAADAANNTEVKINSFKWVDFGVDKVGKYEHFMPDNEGDGHFRLYLKIPKEVEIYSIHVYSKDNPGHIWITDGSYHWPIVIFNNNKQINTKVLSSLGKYNKDVIFDIFANDSGMFNVGNKFVVEVYLNNQQTLTQECSIDNLNLDKFSYKPEEFNIELAKKAAEYSMLAYEDYMLDEKSGSYYTYEASPIIQPARLINLLRSQKFLKVQTYNYEQEKITKDNVSFVIANKKVDYFGKARTLINVIVRGTNEIQWKGNMDVTGTKYDKSQDVHTSFKSAEQEIIVQLQKYISDNKIDSALLFITGHSRGAAVANLLAADMTEKKGANIDGVFAYTFATPNATKNPKALNNIFNFCFDDDFVPQVPLEQWGYKKNGKTFTAVAEDLYLKNSKFKSAMDKYVNLSDPKGLRTKASFNKKATKELIDYVKSMWSDIEKYYNKLVFFTPASPLTPITINTSLYNFFRNFVAPAAMDPNLQNGSYIASMGGSSVYGQIVKFFVTGSLWNDNINDTHQMFTYYTALNNDGFLPIVTLQKSSTMLKIGQTEQMTAIVSPMGTINKGVKWSSSDNKIITVDQNGKVTAVGVGKAQVIVTTDYGKRTAMCTVTVYRIK